MSTERESLFEDGPRPSGEPGFGECEGCGLSVESVGWDLLCFSCQEEERELNDERDMRLAEEDHYLYAIPWDAA